MNIRRFFLEHELKFDILLNIIFLFMIIRYIIIDITTLTQEQFIASTLLMVIIGIFYGIDLQRYVLKL